MIVARSSSPPRLRRWAAVAALVMIAQLVTALHAGWTRHERCAAHGEMVHVGDAVAPPTTWLDTGAGGRKVLARDPAPAHPAEHDHCVESAAPAVTAFAAIIPAIAAVVHRAPAPPLRAPTAVVALFRVAPKTSPPAA